MVREIMRDPLFLGKRSVPADEKDADVMRDLADTLAYHRAECVGMAANMIGVSKNIIAIMNGPAITVMVNAAIVDKKGPYMAEEGCLSLLGRRPAKRWREITVEYCDTRMEKHREKFSGFTAEIVQHELDHVAGVLI